MWNQYHIPPCARISIGREISTIYHPINGRFHHPRIVALHPSAIGQCTYELSFLMIAVTPPGMELDYSKYHPNRLVQCRRCPYYSRGTYAGIIIMKGIESISLPVGISANRRI